MAFEYFSFANVEDVRATLEAVVGICGGSDMVGLMKAATIIGLLVAVSAGLLVLQKASQVTSWFLCLIIVYSVIFVPKETVLITDITGQQPAATVQNVPLGLAFFAATTTHIGYWMTNQMETAFALPASMKFSQSGLLFGAKLVQSARSVGIQNPELRRDLIMYVRNCLNPDVLANYPGHTASELRASTNIIAAIGGTNPARWTTVQGTSLNCVDAHASITLSFNAETTSVLQRFANQNFSSVQGAQALLLIQSQFPDAASTILGVAEDSSNYLKQQMMFNLFNDAAVAIPQMLGDPTASQTALAKAQADQTAAVTYGTNIKIAEETLPMLRNGIELMVVALFPLIFIIVLAGGVGGLKALKSYVMALFFVQLWAPLYAILNFISYRRIAGVAQAETVGGYANTLANADPIAFALGNQMNLLGMLALSIPLIAAGIVKASEMGVTGLASAALAPATGAASGAAGQQATGNVNVGNSSTDNSSSNNQASNKLDRQWLMAMDAATYKGGGVESMSWKGNGGGETVKFNSNEPGYMAGSVLQASSRAFSTEASNSMAQSKSESVQAASEKSAGLSNVISSMKSRTTAQDFSKSVDSGTAARWSNEAQGMQSLKESAMKTLGINETTAAKLAAQAGVSAGVGTPAFSPVKLQSQMQARIAADYGVTKAQQFKSSLGAESGRTFTNAASFMENAASNESFRSGVVSNQADRTETSAQFARAQKLSESSQANLQRSASLSEKASEASQGTSSAQFDYMKHPSMAKPLRALNEQVGRAMQVGDSARAVGLVNDFHATYAPQSQPGAVGEIATMGNGSEAPTQAGLIAAQANQGSGLRSSAAVEVAHSKNAKAISANVAAVGPSGNLTNVPNRLSNANERINQQAGTAAEISRAVTGKVEDETGKNPVAQTVKNAGEFAADTARSIPKQMKKMRKDYEQMRDKDKG
jgi:conjugal transfer mating pair stabilization protein TraG